MVEIKLDVDALMIMLPANAAFAEMAYPDMSDAKLEQIIERLTTGPEFAEMVKQCLTIDGEPLDGDE